MQQDTLRERIDECRKKISEVPKFSKDVLSNCYVMRLRICIVSYKYRLAGLIVEANEYEEQMERLRAGVVAVQHRKKLLSRPTVEQGYLCPSLPVAPQRPKRYPVPIPRRKFSMRPTFGGHVTLPGGYERQTEAFSPQETDYVKIKPIPKPRTRRLTTLWTLPQISASSSPNRPKTSVAYSRYRSNGV